VAPVGVVVFAIQRVRRIVRHGVDEAVHGFCWRSEDLVVRVAGDLVSALGGCGWDQARGKGDEDVLLRRGSAALFLGIATFPCGRHGCRLETLRGAKTSFTQRAGGISRRRLPWDAWFGGKIGD
jgi:hypothetical protein